MGELNDVGDTGELDVKDTVELDAAHVDTVSAHRSSDRVPLPPVDRIAHYRLETALGAGGMGEVFAAFDERLERRVAVKILPASRAVDRARQRMLREARAASALNHPGIVTVHEIGESDGLTYIVMELVEGETLRELVARRGRVAPREAVALVADVGDALSAAHEAGVLHRDVKTANLMVDRRGRVRVLDFGLSKRLSPGETERAQGDDAAAGSEDVDPSGATVSPSGATSGSDELVTEHGARLGTPGYAALELVDGKQADERSDVFSLGVVLYELLTGRLPYRADTWGALRDRLVAERFDPPGAGSADPELVALDAVCARALRADPADRYATVAALVDAARAAVAVPRRSSGRLAAIAGGVGLVAVVGAVALYAARDRDPEEGSPAGVHLDAAPVPEPPPAPVPITSMGGCQYSPAFIGDHTLVFDHTAGDVVDLYAVPVRDGAPRQLTSDDTWEWRAAPGRTPGEVVYVISDTNPTLTSDVSGIGALDIATGDAKTLTNVSTTMVAATRDALYYGGPAVSTIRRFDGTVDDVAFELPPEMVAQAITASADGRLLALVSGGSLASVRLCIGDVATSELSCHAPEEFSTASRVAFSSDGTEVYYAGPDVLRAFSIADGTSRVAARGVSATGGVAVSPDGSALVYSDCISRADLYITDGTNPVRVDIPWIHRAEFGPAGSLLYTVIGPDENGLFQREADGSVRQLTRPALGRVTGFDFSRTDNEVVVSVIGPRPGIYLVHPDGRPPVQLTHGDGDSIPMWLPDRRIVFVRWEDDGVPRMYVVSRDGGEVEPARTLAGAPVGIHPKTGEVLVVVPGGSARLRWWNPVTGKERLGRRIQLPGGADQVDVTMSRNAEWLLLRTGQLGQKVWRVPMTPEDAEPELVYEVDAGQTLSPPQIDDDGRVLVLPISWRGELYRLDAPAGRPW